MNKSDDCDVYYCPKSGEFECSNCGGFALCCSDLERHIYPDSLNDYARICRTAADKWYYDPETGETIVRNIGEQIALIHSEVSEAMEGFRKDLMDDHLPHRKMAEVELADAFIRIFDLAGEQGFDLDGAVREKIEYNARRADHKNEARTGEGGKKW